MKRRFLRLLVRILRSQDALYETNGSEWRDYLMVDDALWEAKYPPKIQERV